MSSVTGFPPLPCEMPQIEASVRCGSSRMLERESLDTSKCFKELAKEYFKKIESLTRDYKNPETTIEEVDAQISRDLSLDLKKEESFTEREAIAKAVLLTGRRSLITDTETIWGPIWQILKPYPQLFFGIHLRTVSDNFIMLMQLIRSRSLTQEQGAGCLAEILNFATLRQELNQFQTPALRKQLLECLRSIDHVCFVNVFLKKMNGSARKIYANPLLKEALVKFLPCLGDYLKEIRNTLGTQTLYLGACQMGFLRDNPDTLSYLVNQLNVKSAEYNKSNPDPCALVGLATLTLVLNKISIAQSDSQKKEALESLCNKTLDLTQEELNKVFLSQLAKALEYAPAQVKFFLKKLALKAVEDVCELNQGKVLLETLCLPMIKHMGEKAMEQFDSFFTMILAALNVISSTENSSDVEMSLQIIDLANACIESLEKQSKTKIEIFREKHDAGTHIVNAYLKEIAPTLTLEKQEDMLASIISKISRKGVFLYDDGIGNFIQKIASVLEIDAHYSKITKDDVRPNFAARNPSMIWYLNKCLTHSTCEIPYARLQAFADRIFCIRNVKAILDADLSVCEDYLQLYATLKKSYPDLTICKNTAIEILSINSKVIESPTEPLFSAYTDLLAFCVFPPRMDDEENLSVKEDSCEKIEENSPQRDSKAILDEPKGTSVEKKTRKGFVINFGFKEAPLEYRICRALENWLEVAKKLPLLSQMPAEETTPVSSEKTPPVFDAKKWMYLFADFLTKNTPENLDMFACAESILPHFPQLALEIITRGVESRSCPSQRLLSKKEVLSGLPEPVLKELFKKLLKKDLKNYSAHVFNVFIKKWIEFVSKFKNPVVGKCVDAFVVDLVKNWPTYLDVYAYAESIVTDVPKMAIDMMRVESDFYPSLGLLSNEMIQAKLHLGELQLLFEKSLKKSLMTYSQEALVNFKTYACKTALQFDDWESFIQTTLIRPGMDEKQVHFVNNIREELNKLFSEMQTLSPR